jgi:hypothetical protein
VNEAKTEQQRSALVGALVRQLVLVKEKEHAAVMMRALVNVAASREERIVVTAALLRRSETQLDGVLLRCLAELIDEANTPESSSIESAAIRGLALKANVRSAALNLLSFFSRVEILSNYIRDSDFRVRLSSLDGLYRIHHHSQLPSSIYFQLEHVLTDLHSEVRQSSLRLCHAVACSYAETQIASALFTSRVRMVDDAFARVCCGVLDSDCNVRAESCLILAKFGNVKEEYLLQTLSKELISRDMQGHRHVRARAQTRAERDGTWSEFDANLIDSASAGAIVVALEDEFAIVRSNAITAIAQLSKYSTRFAEQAVEFLVDMFNDEIDHVRVAALQSVMNLVALREEQVSMVIALLADRSAAVRDAACELLACCTAPSTHILASMAVALATHSRHSALASLGQRHSAFAPLLVDDLLRLDALFQPIEPNAEDPYYASLMVFFFNAAQHNPSLIHLLPSYAAQHYALYRDVFPSIPRALTEAAHVDEPQAWLAQHRKRIGDAAQRIAAYLAPSGNPQLAQRSIAELHQAALHMARLSRDTAVPTFLCLYADALRIVVRVMLHPIRTISHDVAARLILLTYRMEQFLNLDDHTRNCIREIWRFAQLVRRIAQQLNPQAGVEVSLHAIMGHDNEKGLDVLTMFRFSALGQLPELRQIKARIVQPQSNIERAFECFGALPITLTFTIRATVREELFLRARGERVSLWPIVSEGEGELQVQCQFTPAPKIEFDVVQRVSPHVHADAALFDSPVPAYRSAMTYCSISPIHSLYFNIR